MRARGTEIADEAAIIISFEDRDLRSRRGETLAATLAAHGESRFRRTASDAERGIFCGMGVCQDCLVEIDGRPNQRACMTKVDRPLTVRRQRTPASLVKDTGDAVPDPWPAGVNTQPDMLVVGGGAGGLTAAAVAAEAGASVVLIDERPAPGGQYYKQPHETLRALPLYADDRQFEGGRRLIERAVAAGVMMLPGAVWNATRELEVTVFDGSDSRRLHPRRLIVATGAYERGLPVPGWTLPGVMTTGAAQTLLRSYGVLPGARIAVAGNGPLNLQVACELARAGAEIVAVAEASPAPGLGSLATLARMALAAPDLLIQGRGYLRDLKRRGVTLQYGRALTGIETSPGGLIATLSPAGPGTELEIEADAVLMGYGFMPSNEILRLLGCAHNHDPRRGHLVTRRDAECRATVASVFAIGDCCGLGGARAALAEGVIAGLAAAHDAGYTPPARLVAEGASARAALRRQRRFQAALWTLFAAPSPLPDPLQPDTVICRCEEVTSAHVEKAFADGFHGMSEVKRLTRLGMGRCQGRYCAPILADLVARRFGTASDEFTLFAPRPPLKPVPLKAIEDNPIPDQSA